MHTQDDIAFRFRTPEQRAKVVIFDVCKIPQNYLVTIATSLSLLQILCQLNNPHTEVYQC